MLRFDQVRKTFDRTVAVDDLTLTVRRGEVLGLLGPNGAGKTTSVNLALGLLSPDRGTVELEGLGPPDRPEARRRVGVAPQSPALYETLCGEANLAFFGRLYGLSGRKLRDRVDAALEFVGLADRRGDRVGHYSGGMLRRLNLAAALVHEPELLILDEPTVGVDPQSRSAILEHIRELSERGSTIVYFTHYMEEAQRLCDRVAVIDHGRLLALDTVRGLIAAHGGKSTVSAVLPEGPVIVETDDPGRELIRLQQRGELTQFEVEGPDLESVFLSLTGRRLRN